MKITMNQIINSRLSSSLLPTFIANFWCLPLSFNIHTFHHHRNHHKMLAPILRNTITPVLKTNITKSLPSATHFHTSSRKNFDIPFLKQIPQPPGYIIGTVNDAFIPPHASKSHGSLHWSVERAIAVGLVPLATVPFITGSFAPVLDSIFATTVLAHSFIGFQACIIDYIPKRVYGKQHNYAMYLLSVGTVVAAYGVYLIEKDVGLSGLVAKIWSGKPTEEKKDN